MNILVTNDDGFQAKGLITLQKSLSKIAKVWLIAPMTEQSAKSHSFSLHRPVKIQRIEPNVITVDGTPSDCVYIGFNLFDVNFDFVVSGINHGTNLGTDIHYSGTAAGAREGCLLGVKAIAVSMGLRKIGQPNFQRTADLVTHILPQLQQSSAPRFFYNLNVPDTDEPTEVRVAKLGHRKYNTLCDVRCSPRGTEYAWIGGQPADRQTDEICDVSLFAQGFATLTTVSVDSTAYQPLQELDIV